MYQRCRKSVNAELQETEQGLLHVYTQKISLLKGNWAGKGGIGRSHGKMEQTGLQTQTQDALFTQQVLEPPKAQVFKGAAFRLSQLRTTFRKQWLFQGRCQVNTAFKFLLG